MARYSVDDPRSVINRAKLIHLFLRVFVGVGNEISMKDLKAAITWGLGVHGAAVDAYIRTLKDGKLIDANDENTGSASKQVVVLPGAAGPQRGKDEERLGRVMEKVRSLWDAQ